MRCDERDDTGHEEGGKGTKKRARVKETVKGEGMSGGAWSYVVGDATCRALRSCFGDDDRRTNIDATYRRKKCPLKTTAEYKLIHMQGFLNALIYHPWPGDMSHYCR